MKDEYFKIDPIHDQVDIFGQDITKDVWAEKYRWGDEAHPLESMQRVVEGVYAHDPNKEERQKALEAMQKALWVPGGRIHAGAGTPKAVTLLNCYVCRTIGDSMDEIANALKDAMLTQQQGGGIGMDFSTLRPSGAYLKRTGAVASGPLPFMDMWDAMCATIMSAGSRRGAMMATMCDDHPDLPKFITAKQQAGRLTNFNISVLISDAFMDAVANDEEWFLGFDVPRADGKHVAVVDNESGPWYVYEVWKARELWELIMKNTYEYSEPGVIFIDRINDTNNLAYCEKIRCTNPCGEQPLPPNGACNLGAVNLARMVRRPFTANAEFDYGLLEQIVKVGVRFLDNVIDVTNYPLDSQAEEERSKRRIGLGITGLGNALMELGVRYGSQEALHITNTIMSTIKHAAYEASALLAAERGPFPLYDPEKWGQGSPVVASLSDSVKELIDLHGIRNGVLLTIAPTGTTSLYMGNVSSGLEPVFLFETHRKVRQADNTFKEYVVQDYGYQLYRKVRGVMDDPQSLPSYMVTHADLSVEDHVRMQAVCQKHVDASVSKTINCPKDMTYDEFKLVYWDAYNSGCKGCTTYRPSDVRGSVLSSGKEDRRALPRTRPESLAGTTYKVKWPNTDAGYYITINDLDGRPFEMFIASTSSRYSEWTTALSLLISAIMRLEVDISFVPEELKKVVSFQDTAWINGKMYGSLVALIGDILGKHINPEEKQSVVAEPLAHESKPQAYTGNICPKCNMPSVAMQEGCKVCLNCNFSTCG